jgi:hypothetical protein
MLTTTINDFLANEREFGPFLVFLTVRGRLIWQMDRWWLRAALGLGDRGLVC